VGSAAANCLGFGRGCGCGFCSGFGDLSSSAGERNVVYSTCSNAVPDLVE